MIYDEILKIFQSDDELRPWMTKPFLVGERAAATNAYAIVLVPKWEGDYERRDEKIGQVLNITPNMSHIIMVADLRAEVDKIPLVDDSISTECEACKGEGEVQFEYYYRQTYYEDIDCPVCDGAGCITTPNSSGKKILDPNALLRLGNSVFYLPRIEELLKTADQLGADRFRVIYQETGTKPTVVEINDVEVLMMPAVSNKQASEDLPGIKF